MDAPPSLAARACWILLMTVAMHRSEMRAAAIRPVRFCVSRCASSGFRCVWFRCRSCVAPGPPALPPACPGFSIYYYHIVITSASIYGYEYLVVVSCVYRRTNHDLFGIGRVVSVNGEFGPGIYWYN